MAMTMARGCIVAAVAMIVAGMVPARAAEDYCINPNTGQVDAQATESFRQLEQAMPPRFRQFAAGVWYRHASNPYTGQTSDQYQKFEANGLWNYQDTVCSAQGFCSHYSGVGLFAARPNNAVRFGFFGAIDVSDSTRNHQCVDLSGRALNRNQFVDSTNTVWQRVQ